MTKRFLILVAAFCVCLVASNIYASKLFLLFGKFTLSGAVIIFPVSYIINDCLSEVYGYRKASFAIWVAFAFNILFVLVSQLVILLPGAPFWDGQEAFRTVLGATVRTTAASLLAFLLGSNVNAMVMSKMKVADSGRRFGLRAIVSSLAGESVDSLVFVPIVFWNMGLKVILVTMACQIVAKVVYEMLILPLTAIFVRKLKEKEKLDVFDEEISYSIFKFKDIRHQVEN